ncbi:MAG TPA: nucleoside 2-deoxyribosyltransferase [Candidatus Thermoplasmatota archaeon]|nr:nucleoside 2-deoxyribosyltransferase [Candidatus Thermoplasmatota archaeon]
MARRIFFASPEYSAGDLELIDSLLLRLEVVTQGRLKGSDLFVPHLNVGDYDVDVPAQQWVDKCLAALKEADIVVCVLNGRQADDGTAYFLGVAHALGKYTIGYLSERRQLPHPALLNACTVNVYGGAKELGAALLEGLARVGPQA